MCNKSSTLSAERQRIACMADNGHSHKIYGAFASASDETSFKKASHLPSRKKRVINCGRNCRCRDKLALHAE